MCEDGFCTVFVKSRNVLWGVMHGRVKSTDFQRREREGSWGVRGNYFENYPGVLPCNGQQVYLK